MKIISELVAEKKKFLQFLLLLRSKCFVIKLQNFSESKLMVGCPFQQTQDGHRTFLAKSERYQEINMKCKVDSYAKNHGLSLIIIA